MTVMSQIPKQQTQHLWIFKDHSSNTFCWAKVTIVILSVEETFNLKSLDKLNLNPYIVDLSKQNQKSLTF